MNLKKADKIKEKLKNHTVGIAGLGGLGSNAAMALARAGIGRLILLDFDVVDDSNLTRQYYFLDQIGKSKTIALKDNIKKANPKIVIDIFNEKLKKGTMETRFKDADVIIEALDNAETKVCFIEEILTKLPNTPIIAASGVTGYGHSDRISTKHLGKLFLCYDELAQPSEDDILLAPRVALIANWQANLALEIILGEDI